MLVREEIFIQWHRPGYAYTFWQVQLRQERLHIILSTRQHNEVHHTLDDEAVVVDLTAQVLVVFTTSDGAGCCPQRSALF